MRSSVSRYQMSYAPRNCIHTTRQTMIRRARNFFSQWHTNDMAPGVALGRGKTKNFPSFEGFETLILPTSARSGSLVAPPCDRLRPLYPRNIGPMLTEYPTAPESKSFDEYLQRVILLREQTTPMYGRPTKQWLRASMLNQHAPVDNPCSFVQRFTEKAPPALITLSPQGKVRYCNNMREVIKVLSIQYERLVHEQSVYDVLQAECAAGNQFLLWDPDSPADCVTTPAQISQHYNELTEFSPAFVVFAMLCLPENEVPWKF